MYIYCFQAYYWGGADRQIQEILRIISGFNFFAYNHSGKIEKKSFFRYLPSVLLIICADSKPGLAVECNNKLILANSCFSCMKFKDWLALVFRTIAANTFIV